ncbi:Organic hydroperoxide resistance protein [uncultured delta proteobacterium]|uniref:Organic hydroperoxide resistance protein n=1 Tax=uncultured delta proteobacterium TaxID=34034 RepID=A0A212K7N3_9DELT|nr:Organic hydroperoxide resistance protein [uncultured delta proteobacterium]
MALSKIMYSTTVTVTGGRDGEAVSGDGNLRVKLGMPKEMGGAGGNATNPEQLFAAGYAACFLSAMKMLAGKKKIAISPNPSIVAAVDLGTSGEKLGLQVALTVKLPGMDKAEAEKLVELAHQTCPYSNATRGNIDVALTVLTQ